MHDKGLIPIEFKSMFLRSVGEALRRRSKAIRHFTDLSWETSADHDATHEWLVLYLDPHPDPLVQVELQDPWIGDVFLCSQRSVDRGKVILRIEDMVLLRSGAKIVAALERTLHLVHGMAVDDRQTIEAVRRTWDAVRVSRV